MLSLERVFIFGTLGLIGSVMQMLTLKFVFQCKTILKILGQHKAILTKQL